MGYDAICTLHLDGRSSRGTALLEHEDLIFRGEIRLAIPLSAITSARADGPGLEVTWGTRTATFQIGPLAAKWADRITNPPSRLDKLGVKAGLTVRIVDLHDDAFVDEVVQRGARIVKRGAGAYLLFYGAHQREALARLPALVEAIAPDGGIWVVRPKGVKTITEEDVRAAGKQAGLVDVKVVSFSDTHTAEKFVIPVAKRATPSRPSPPPRTRGSSSSRDRS
jgi:hypothetical protein